jgi:hypothetical protein
VRVRAEQKRGGKVKIDQFLAFLKDLLNRVIKIDITLLGVDSLDFHAGFVKLEIIHYERKRCPDIPRFGLQFGRSLRVIVLS